MHFFVLPLIAHCDSANRQHNLNLTSLCRRPVDLLLLRSVQATPRPHNTLLIDTSCICMEVF